MTDTIAMSADPGLFKKGDKDRLVEVSELTYEEARELGRYGTGLLHPLAVAYVMDTVTTTHLKNTFDESKGSTVYTDSLLTEDRRRKPMALSLINPVTTVTVTERGMAEAIGRVSSIQEIFSEAGISLIDDISNGCDSQKFIANSEDLKGIDIEQTLGSIRIHEKEFDVATSGLIAVVGRDIRYRFHKVHGDLIENGIIDEEVDEPPFHAQHAIRFTVPIDSAKEKLSATHAALIEK